MYHSCILLFSLVPILGLALPTTTPSTGTNTAPTGNIISLSRQVQQTPKINSLANITNQFATINYFPDPEVSCSGRHLYDETSTWSADLTAAVTSTTKEGIFGTCDAGSEVNGSGNLAWKSGRVQVYYCNHGFTPNPCSVNEYWRANVSFTMLSRIPIFHVLECSRIQYFRARSRTNVTIRISLHKNAARMEEDGSKFPTGARRLVVIPQIRTAALGQNAEQNYMVLRRTWFQIPPALDFSR
ncbi:hypothetical protein DHEL01_v211226 [Diaporthe helianthi]|uniref:Uncharacterized protein n=1 Tax=Diaporthe helianthi TaxID=158607 RepID=A0A2P5HJE6_DIAHE|nr:hypothetical protein DHEL01_v211226 [Diaporthe helianthi]